MTNFDRLKAFRHKSYMLTGNGKDALFDLMDAVLVSRSVYSFAELSVAPIGNKLRRKGKCQEDVCEGSPKWETEERRAIGAIYPR